MDINSAEVRYAILGTAVVVVLHPAATLELPISFDSCRDFAAVFKIFASSTSYSE